MSRKQKNREKLSDGTLIRVNSFEKFYNLNSHKLVLSSSQLVLLSYPYYTARVILYLMLNIVETYFFYMKTM